MRVTTDRNLAARDGKSIPRSRLQLQGSHTNRQGRNIEWDRYVAVSRALVGLLALVATSRRTRKP